MKRAKKVIAAVVVIACLSFAGMGTLAYFTAEETAHNVISSGNVDIELIEKHIVNGQETDFPKNGIFDVMPNTTVSKIVRVENVGGGDAFVRVKVNTNVELVGGGEGDAIYLSMDFPEQQDGAAWVERDGWWYYMAVGEAGVPGLLPAGAEGSGVGVTAPLFTEVSFDADMPNEYQGSTATVSVIVQAVQSANNGSSALDAAGWPTGMHDAA